MIRNVFCVHQIGKVGSTSLVRTLERMLGSETIYQTHVLSENGVLLAMQAWLDHPLAPYAPFPDHLASSIELRRHFAPGAAPVNWFLLSVVREPVSRDISAFFQNLQRQWIYLLPSETRALCERALGSKEDGASVPEEKWAGLVDELIALFKRCYGGEKCQRWFDREMRDVFGIDVFSRDFPAEKGYQFYRSGRAKLGLFRLEDLPATFVPAVGEWLEGSGLSPVAGDARLLERERANDGSAKAYADLYRRFLAAFSLAPGELEPIYDSRAVRHFYTAGEIDAFTAKWGRRPEAGSAQPAPALSPS